MLVDLSNEKHLQNLFELLEHKFSIIGLKNCVFEYQKIYSFSLQMIVAYDDIMKARIYEV